MLQIYKQNRALLQALCVSSMAPTPIDGGGGESKYGSFDANKDDKLNAAEFKKLLETAEGKEVEATAKAEADKVAMEFAKNLFAQVDSVSATSGNQEMARKTVQLLLRRILGEKGENASIDGLWGGGTKKDIKSVLGTDASLYTESGITKAGLQALLAKAQGVTTTVDDSTAVISEAKEIDVSVFTRPLFKGVSNGDDVKMLQQLLKAAGKYDKKIDGDFGPGTDKALRAYQGVNADGIAGSGTLSKLTGKEVKVRKLTAAERAQINGISTATTTTRRREAVVGAVRASNGLAENIKVTGRSIDKLTQFIRETSGKEVNSIYNAIKKGKDFDAQGYHILNLVQRAFGRTERTKARNRAAEIFNIVNGSGNRLKFERAYTKLLGNQYKDTGGRDATGELTHQGRNLMRHARKALPWIAGVYVADIPLPFMRKMVPSGVPMDKAFAFTRWVKEGMKGEFNPRAKVETGTEALSHLKGLRNILGTATSYIEANANRGNLKQVAGKVRTLIRTYIVHRFGPDANIIRESAQNPFENLFDAIGIHGKSKTLINKVVRDAARGNVNFNDVFKLEEVLWAEDNDGIFGIGNGANAGFIRDFAQRNAYMASASRQGDIIDQYVAAIAAGKGAFQEVQRQERAYAGIPDTTAKYRKGLLRPGVYGPALGTNWSGAQVLQALQSTRPSAKANRDSIGWLMYGIRNLETDMDARKIPYSVIANAIGRGKMVPIGSVGKQAVNTSISGKIMSTDIATLMGRGDTHLFHAPIEYTIDGQKLKYNLYLRPDCSNFVMVPEQWNNNVGVGVNGRLPIVIPWNILIHNGSAGTAGSNPIDDTPIEPPVIPHPQPTI